MPDSASVKERLPFEQQIPIIQIELAKRKNKHTLSTVAWEDVCQIIMIRVFNKYNLYDPEKVVFTHWLNRLISNAMKNILRDFSGKWQRPCALGCAFAVGADECSLPSNKSGKQCEECPLYRRWKNKKQNQFFVNQTLTIENHSQEVNSAPSDFFDIDGSKKIIDRELKKRLNHFEWSVYEMLYIKNLDLDEVVKKLGYKRSKNSKEYSKQNIAKLRKKFIELTKEIIEEEGLA